MKNKNYLIIGLALVVLLTISLSGCQVFYNNFHEFKGSIFGNTYTIDNFDNFGTKVFTTRGEKINVVGNIVKEENLNSEGIDDRTINTLSSVLTINIDGKQMVSCGDTLVFFEDGLVPDVEFSLEDITSESKGVMDNTFITAMINDVKNKFGKSSVVVIKSQTGFPIYAFSGNSVYWEIPDDLPKFTKVSIDGKALYIHRANFQIIDKNLLK